jgi:hypothetical protein
MYMTNEQLRLIPAHFIFIFIGSIIVRLTVQNPHVVRERVGFY